MNPRSASPCRPARAEGGAGGGAMAVANAPCRPRSAKPPPAKSTIPKRGPPPAAPKKVDYKKPAMTKAMAQRLKHTQKFQEDLERKEREKAQAAANRRPRRTAAPVGGDARMGRERRAECPPARRSRPASKEPPPCPGSEGGPSAGPSCPPSRSISPPTGPRGRSPASAASAPVSSRTRNLAKSMNADIVQAEPLQAGPVDNVIIPPGAINSERTTIVSIPQPAEGPGTSHLPSSTMAPSGGSAANRSIQVISETLDEQDAAESSVVNSKLLDLQQARRDFVMAVANVGGNAISLQDEEFPNVTPISEITPPMMMSPEPSSPRLQRCLSIEDPYLQVEYGRHHPVVESAREFLRTRQTDRRMDENFARIACQPPIEDFEQDYLEGCGIVPTGDDDDDDICQPAQNYTQIPRREPYRYDPLEMDRLERFFDLDKYPPRCPLTPPQEPRGPPPGRECLNPDLWDLQDPWYNEPDLIQWDD